MSKNSSTTPPLTMLLAGGRHLAQVRKKLIASLRPGLTPRQTDMLADKLIAQAGDQPAFKTFPGYNHATCININSGIVHGLPSEVPYQPSDLVTIDVGLIHHGYHFDTSVTVQLPPRSSEVDKFLSAGRSALKKAIRVARPGRNIYQVSRAMQTAIEKAGYSVVTQLVGHGIGRKLHQPPQIPCYADPASRADLIQPGQMLAIEIMYAMGDARLKTTADGWTMETIDGSLSAMFEHTVLITPTGPRTLT